MNYDEEHLRLLRLGHFIVAGVTALFACFPIFHLIIGIVFIVSPPQNPQGDLSGRWFGFLFVGIASAIILVGWTLAICIFLAGRFMQQRRHYNFCLVTAGFCLPFFPLGTILGVFTLLVLTRPSVKEIFGKVTLRLAMSYAANKQANREVMPNPPPTEKRETTNPMNIEQDHKAW